MRANTPIPVSADQPALAMDDVTIRYHTATATVNAVTRVSMRVERGEAVGVVGESGSGKSTLASACIGMLDIPMLNRTPVSIDGGIRIVGRDISQLRSGDWNQIRGVRVGYVGQDPFGALNPVLTVRHHMAEALRIRPRGERDLLTERLLRSVELPPEIASAYPLELSGGMRQRVAIAMAIANDPELLIADEPTTALDVTTQAEVLRLLHDLRERTGMALLLITHDLGVVAQICQRAYVMRSGVVVEAGPVHDVLTRPVDPYTRSLLIAARLEKTESGAFRENSDAPLPRTTREEGGTL